MALGRAVPAKNRGRLEERPTRTKRPETSGARNPVCFLACQRAREKRHRPISGGQPRLAGANSESIQDKAVMQDGNLDSGPACSISSQDALLFESS